LKYCDGLPRAQIDGASRARLAKLNIALNFTVPIFWRVVRTAPSQRDPQAIKQAVSALNGFLAIVECQVTKHLFLASSDFPLADIQFGHVLYRYFDIDFERSNSPHLQGYYSRLRERQPFMKHVAISYNELRFKD